MENNNKPSEEKKSDTSSQKVENSSAADSVSNHQRPSNPQRNERWWGAPILWHNKEEGAE